MLIPSFFKNLKSKQNRFLTLCLNSSGVKCLAMYKDGTLTKIIGRGEQNLDPGSIRNGIIVDKGSVIEALESCIYQATQNAEGSIKEVIIGITGDLCQEVVTTAKITRANVNPLTLKEIELFQKKIIESAYLQIQKDYADATGNSDTDFDLITSSVVYTKLDNNKEDNPVGKTGQIMEMALYTAFCPKHHLNTLRQISKKLGLKILAISSQSFSLLKALKVSNLEYNDLTTMQVGSDFTCVCVIFGGAVITSKNLHIGKKHLVEQISHDMGLTNDDANKILYSYLKGSLGQSESSIIQKCLDDVLNIWLEGVEIMFKDFSGVKTFAPVIYMFDEGSLIPELVEFLEKNPWTKSIPFKAPPKITVLDMSSFSNITDATGTNLPNEFIPVAALSYIYEEVL